MILVPRDPASTHTTEPRGVGGTSREGGGLRGLPSEGSATLTQPVD
jgi:hypothetical protein